MTYGFENIEKYGYKIIPVDINYAYLTINGFKFTEVMDIPSLIKQVRLLEQAIMMDTLYNNSIQYEMKME